MPTIAHRTSDDWDDVLFCLFHVILDRVRQNAYYGVQSLLVVSCCHRLSRLQKRSHVLPRWLLPLEATIHYLELPLEATIHLFDLDLTVHRVLQVVLVLALALLAVPAEVGIEHGSL